MKKSTFLLCLTMSCMCSFAQLITPFSIRYQSTQKGGIRYISNSSVSCSASASCTTGRNEIAPAGTSTDNGFSAAYVDIDGDPTTFMSSSDSLALPGCSEIIWAGLYWGAQNQAGGNNYANRNSCKIKANNGSYVNITANASQDNTVGFTTYHCFTDITAIVKAAGTNARFTVANVATHTGSTNVFGGWTIVVVYRNDLQPMRNLTVFNGLSNVSGTNPTTNVPISGFLTPLSGPVTFEIGAVTYDGDRASTGDQLLFKGASAFVNISDAVNPANDVFNSTLSYNGINKTTPFVNPAFNNTLGYDADIFIPNNAAKNYIGNSATAATLQLTTGGETYLTQVLTLAIDVYEPDVRAFVRVKDVNGGIVEPGDTLEYTVGGKNIGSDPGVNVFVTDTLERNAFYVPGSLQIISGPNQGVKTDITGDDQAEYIAASRLIRVRIGTGANAITGGTVINSPLGIDSTVFKYRVTATQDCLVLQCDSVINNSAYIVATGNVSGNTFSNGSNPDIFDGNGCPIPGATQTPIDAGLCVPAAASGSTPVCLGSTISLSTSNSPFASYAWTGPNSFTSAIYNPTIANATTANAGTYTVVVTIPGTTCSYSLPTTVAVNTGSNAAGLAGTAGGGAAIDTHDLANGNYYNDVTCNLISNEQSTGAAPVTGSITSSVWIEPTVPNILGQPYVARHYEITPAQNPATATGTVTLYFLQSEFDAFNAAPGSTLSLPTGPGDAAGIANMRVGHYEGTSSNGSGLANTYSKTLAVIDPADGNIVWNATAGRWEITFTTTGFGGFVIQTTPTALPITLVSFTVEKNGNKALLKWQTSGEVNSDHFAVERSTDGRSFAAIGTVAAAGFSAQVRNYNFTDVAPQSPINFYRLVQVDADGTKKYSDIRKLIFNADSKAFIILVNPAKGGMLQVQFNQPGTALIYNAAGQLMIGQQVLTGTKALNVASLAKGIYILQAGGQKEKFIID
jgi:uncharacterized repeat protein (TIGR01451 family)